MKLKLALSALLAVALAAAPALAQVGQTQKAKPGSLLQPDLLGAGCIVVTGNQTYTVGQQQQANCTPSGRWKVGLSSADNVDPAAQPATTLDSLLVGCKFYATPATWSDGFNGAMRCTSDGSLAAAITNLPLTSGGGTSEIVVGGGSGDGVAPSVYSSPIAGIDLSGFKRTLSTDALGDLNVNLFVGNAANSALNPAFAKVYGSNNGALWTDANNRLGMSLYSSGGGTSATVGSQNDANSQQNGLFTYSYGLNFNGTNMDRARSIGGAVQAGTGDAAVAVAPHSSAAGALAPSSTPNPQLSGKASAGNLYGASLTEGATAGFLVIENLATPTASSAAFTAVVECIPVPANDYRHYVPMADVPERYPAGVQLYSSSSCTTYTPVTPLRLKVSVD